MSRQDNAAWALLNDLRGVMVVPADTNRIIFYALILRQSELIWGDICKEYPELEIDEKKLLFNIKMGFDYKESSALGSLFSMSMNEVIINEVCEVLKGYENRYHIDHGILVEPFSNLARKMRNDAIRAIFSRVMEIKVSSSEDLYDIAECLALLISGMFGRVLGESTTNPTIAKLESRLLGCGSSMSLYDGFCGTGISVNKIASKETKIYLRDMDMNMVSLAAILCILGERELKHVSCGDTLLNMKHDMKFDRIVAEPPFGVKYNKDYIEQLSRNGQIPDQNIDGEGLVVFHVLNNLKEDGRAAVLLPMGFLFRAGRSSNTRKILLEMNVIDAIIELPEGCLPGTYMPAVLIIFKKKCEFHDILMIDAKSFFRRERRGMALITDEGIEEIAKMYESRAVVDGLSATPNLEAIVKAEYGLSVAKYVLPVMEVTEKESIKNLLSQYKEKQAELQDVENRLNSLRKRFFTEKHLSK